MLDMKPVCLLQLHRGMMRMVLFSLLLVLMLSAPIAGIAAQADDYAKTIQFYKKSSVVQPFFKNAYGYAVFPAIGKAGFVVGGSYGKGKVYQGGKVTGIASLMELSVGFQAGGEAFSEIIFFEDQRAYHEFTKGNFVFDAEAQGIVVGVGAQAKAGSQGATAGASAGSEGKQAEAKYRKGMAVFVHQKGGLMYEASIGGQKFGFKPNKK
jgi:lipid-binding SYLF domain-containing protein